MDQHSDFYITLYSNSSFNDFPENKTSSFIVNLPRTINLKGKWSVALAEIIYPQTFENVTPGNNVISIEMLQYQNAEPVVILNKENYSIPCGYYSINELINEVNLSFSKHLNLKNALTYPNTLNSKLNFNPSKEELARAFAKVSYAPNDDENEKVPFTHAAAAAATITFRGNLALQLGYEPDKCIIENPARGPPQINLGISSQLLIYCDLIDHQLIADTTSQVLRVIPTLNHDNRFGDVIVRTFNIRNYLPVMKNILRL